MKSNNRGCTGLSGLVAGFCGGAYVALLLPVFARRMGLAGNDGSSVVIVLAPAGAALGHLALRLLGWAGERRPFLGATLPWLAVALLTAGFFFAPDAFGSMASPLGMVKYLLSGCWILGVGVYGFFLMRPLLAAFDPRRVAWGFAAIVLLVSASLSVQPPTESDEADYIAAALAIIDTGSMRVDRIAYSDHGARHSGNGAGHSGLDDFYFGKTPATWLNYRSLLDHGGDVNRYSYRMIGYPFLLAPFLVAARFFQTPAARWFIVYLPGIVGYAFLVHALTRLFARYYSSNPSKRYSIVAMASMTPFLYFATNTQPEIWMAAGLAWCIYFAHRYHIDGESPEKLVVTAVAIMLLHERMVIFSAALICYVLIRIVNRRMIRSTIIQRDRAGQDHRVRLVKIAVIFLAALVPVVISYASVAQWRLPSSLPHAYGAPETVFFDPARWSSAVFQHLFSPVIGILPRLPTLLLLPFAVPALRYRSSLMAKPDDPVRNAALMSLGLFLIYFGVMITYPRTFDSWPHLRYMVPALPALAPCLALAFEKLSEYRGGRILVGSMIALQIIVALPFLAVPILWRSIM